MAEQDEIPLELEAALEIEQSKVDLKRGLASLRWVRRTTYMRRSVLRMLSKAPEEIAAYEPRNGFEMLAKALVSAKGKDGVVAVQVWREVKESLGERIGSRWKDTQEHAQGHPNIVNDLPKPELPN